MVFKLEMVHVDYSEQKNHNSGKCLLCTYVICTVYYTCHLETLVFCSLVLIEIRTLTYVCIHLQVLEEVFDNTAE